MQKLSDFVGRQHRPKVGQDRTWSIFDNFVGQLFADRSTNFMLSRWLFTTEDEYLF